MRIERRRVITVELTREEAVCLRRRLEGALDEEALNLSNALVEGLGQNLYETRENFA